MDFDEILAEILQAEQRGEALSPDEWSEKYPGFEDSINEFFTNRRQLGLTRVFQDDVDEPTLVSGDPVPSPEPFAVGDAIRYFGDYEIVEELARGGMGVVYRAIQKSLGRTVAIKMILSGELASAAHVARFRSEAEAAAGLDHPGIVPIYEIGEQNGQHYFSMAFVDGPSLAQRISDGPLEAREAARIVAAAAAAVQFAHERGVIHRDLKPANILLDGEQPKVTDFGLAKRLDQESMTATGEMLGTPGYMAPEQAQQADQAGSPADVYGLGAILYASMTGRPPFQAANIVETLRQLVEVEPPTPRQLNPEVPLDLNTICMKAMRKDPARRYESAAALESDIRLFLEGRPITARPVPGWEQAWKWAKRRPVTAALSTTLLLTLLCGTLIISRLWLDAAAARDDATAASDRASRRAEEALAAKALADRQTKATKRALVSGSLRLADVMYANGQAMAAEAQYMKELREATARDDGDRRAWWRLWRMYNDHPRESFLMSAGTSLRHSADGTRLAAIDGAIIHVVDGNTLKRVVSLRSPEGTVAMVAFSPNTRFLAVSHETSAAIIVWDLDDIDRGPRRIEVKPAELGLLMKVAAKGVTKNDEQLVQRMSRLVGSRPGIYFADDQQLLIGAMKFLWQVDVTEEQPAPKAVTRRLRHGVPGGPSAIPYAVSDKKIWIGNFGSLYGAPLGVIHRDRVGEERQDVLSYVGVDGDKLVDIPGPTGVTVSMGLPQFVNGLPKDQQNQIVQSNHFAVHQGTLTLALIRGGELSFWDLKSGQRLGVLPGFDSADLGSGGPFRDENSLLFSADGRSLAVVGSEIQIVDVQRRQVRNTFPWVGSPQLTSACFSADGSRLLLVEQPDVSSPARVGIYRTAPLEPTKASGGSRALELAEGGVAAWIENKGPTLLDWTPATIGIARDGKQENFRIPNVRKLQPSILRLSRDGSRLAIFGAEPTDASTLRAAAMDTATGELSGPVTIDYDLVGLAVSGDGSVVSQLNSHGVILRSLPDLKEIGTVELISGSLYPMPEEENMRWGLTQGAAAFSPDGRFLALVTKAARFSLEQLAVVSAHPPELVLIDVQKKSVVTRRKCPDAFSIHVTADGDRLALGARTGTPRVQFYQLPTLENAATWMHADTFASGFAEHAASGLLVCSTESGELCFWDTRRHESLARLKVGEVRISQLSFSADGERIWYGTPRGIRSCDLAATAARVDLIVSQY